MQATQDDLFVSAPIRARRRRDRGMRKAAEHAEDVHVGWNDAALEQLKQFVEQRQFAPFLAEEFKHWAQTRLPPAPDGRAFGPVMQRAAALGVIKSIGFGKANSSNRSPKVLWQKVGEP